MHYLSTDFHLLFDLCKQTGFLNLAANVLHKDGQLNVRPKQTQAFPDEKIQTDSLLFQLGSRLDLARAHLLTQRSKTKINHI